jgi:hypothetical protein
MKITPYNVDKLSPQAVGVPGENRSGEIIGKGIVALGKGVSDWEANIAKRKDDSDKLSASKTFGDYQFEYGARKIAMQNEYADKPEEFPAAVKKMSEDLTAQYGKALQGRAFQYFRQHTSSALAQDSESLATWSFRRDNEIQVGKVDDIKATIALRATTVTGADGLRSIKNSFTQASTEAIGMIGWDADQKLTDEYWKIAQKNALEAQLQFRPNTLKADLEGGAYNGLVDPDVINSYSDKARNAIINRAFDDQYRTLFMAKGKVGDYMTGLDNGSVNLVDLIAEREAIFANRKKMVTPEQQATNAAYLENLDALIAGQTQATVKTPLGAEQKKSVLSEFDRKWDAYLIAKAAENKRPDISDLNKELELQRDLQMAYHSGIINRNEYLDKVAIMSTKHKLSKNAVAGAMPFDQAIDKAGAVSGWWIWTKGNDVVNAGYRMIKAHIDRTYPELLPEERRELKAQMLSQYHQKVLGTPEEVLKGLTTQNQWESFAEGIIKGHTNTKGETVPGLAQANTFYQDTTGQYKLGDIKTENGYKKRLVGVENGVPKWQYLEGQIIVNSRGQKGRVAADGSIEVLTNGQ